MNMIEERIKLTWEVTPFSTFYPLLEPGSMEVSGGSKLIITNTGGSSASEGGMGSGGDTDEKEKGELSKPGESKDRTSGGNKQSGSTGNDSYEDKVKEETEKASNRSV